MKPTTFFVRVDAAHFLQQVLRVPEVDRGKWITEVAIQLVTHDGDNSFAAQLIEEAKSFSGKRSAAGAEGNEKRWAEYRNAIAKVSQCDRKGIAKVSPEAEAEAEAEAEEKNTRAKKQMFVKPTLSEAEEEVKSKGFSFKAESFIDYYGSVGWLVGNKKMKDWKATMRTWQTREKKPSNSQQPKQSQPQPMVIIPEREAKPMTLDNAGFNHA